MRRSRSNKTIIKTNVSSLSAGGAGGGDGGSRA